VTTATSWGSISVQRRHGDGAATRQPPRRRARCRNNPIGKGAGRDGGPAAAASSRSRQCTRDTHSAALCSRPAHLVLLRRHAALTDCHSTHTNGQWRSLIELGPFYRSRTRIRFGPVWVASPDGRSTMAASDRLKQFKVQKLLGKGAFGEVFKATRVTDGQTYALKKINISSMSSREIADTLNEIRCVGCAAVGAAGCMHVCVSNARAGGASSRRRGLLFCRTVAVAMCCGMRRVCTCLQSVQRPAVSFSFRVASDQLRVVSPLSPSSAVTASR
jgi:hypothetical protein